MVWPGVGLDGKRPRGPMATRGSLAVDGLGLVVSRRAQQRFGDRPCPVMPDTQMIEPSAHG